MCESRSRVALTFRKKVRLAVSKTIAEPDQLRPTNSLPFIMQESGAKRPAKLLQRNSTEENDRADTSSDACQVGDADGDVPAHPSKTTELAQTPESSQETAIIIYMHRYRMDGLRSLRLLVSLRCKLILHSRSMYM